jgi:hypothetical protein
MGSEHADRRRNVRTKPLPELPATAVLLGEGLVHESFHVLDISISGMALEAVGRLSGARVGDRIALKLSLAHFGEHHADAHVRRVTPSVCGIEFGALAPEAALAVRRYVNELFERGAAP